MNTFLLYFYLSTIVFVFTIVTIFFNWLKIRPIKGRGIIIPEYEPPEDMPPLQVSLLISSSIIPREFYISEIFYLVSLGHLKLIKEGTDFLLTKNKLRQKYKKILPLNIK